MSHIMFPSALRVGSPHANSASVHFHTPSSASVTSSHSRKRRRSLTSEDEESLVAWSHVPTPRANNSRRCSLASEAGAGDVSDMDLEWASVLVEIRHDYIESHPSPRAHKHRRQSAIKALAVLHEECAGDEKKHHGSVTPTTSFLTKQARTPVPPVTPAMDICDSDDMDTVDFVENKMSTQEASVVLATISRCTSPVSRSASPVCPTAATSLDFPSTTPEAVMATVFTPRVSVPAITIRSSAPAATPSAVPVPLLSEIVEVGPESPSHVYPDHRPQMASVAPVGPVVIATIVTSPLVSSPKTPPVVAIARELPAFSVAEARFAPVLAEAVPSRSVRIPTMLPMATPAKVVKAQRAISFAKP